MAKKPRLEIPEEQQNLTYEALPTLRDFHYSNEFVRGIMGPVGCLPRQTEFLTEYGWKAISDYDEATDLVGEWDEGKLIFRKPKSFVNLPCDEFIEFKNVHTLGMVLSEEHRVPLYDPEGNWVVKTALELEQHPSNYSVPTNFEPTQEGFSLSEEQVRLSVAIKADGHLPKKGSVGRCTMSLRKDRKKIRIRELLQLCGIEWKEYVYSKRPTETVFSFIVNFPVTETFDAYWWKASLKQLRWVFEEFPHWDGLFEGPDTRFSTTNKSDADYIQYVTHAVGGRATISLLDYPKHPTWSRGYLVHIAPKGSVKAVTGIRKGYTSIQRIPSEDGRKYCFETESGFFLARHNRRIFVTGNSGKTVGCIMELYLRALEQRPFNGVRRSRWALIRNTYPELLSTTLKTFEDWIPHEICPVVQSSPIHGTLRVNLADGTRVEAEFIFLALDQEEDTKKLRSLELTGAFINEASEVRKSALDMLTTRVDRYPNKKTMGGITWMGIIMDTNPPSDGHWWYKMAEIEKPLGYRFWKQPPALFKQMNKDNELEYLPNTGCFGIPAAENIDNHNSGFDYYLRMIPGKDLEFIKVFVLGEYGSVFSGKAVYPEYSDTVHCSKEELQPYRGLPLLLTWDFGLCYSEDTEVLTDTGWKFFKDVETTKDQVATRNPDTGKLEYTDINFKVDRPYKGKMLEWASQNVNFCVTPEHRVPYTNRDTPNKVHWDEARWLAEHSGGHHYVDLVSDWQAPEDTNTYFGMDADTFAEFMGLYLSEGCSHKLYGAITIYQNTEPEFFERVLEATGLAWRREKECWRVSHLELARYLRKFGLSGDKYVPEEIRQMSRRQIKLFIRAYTEGDGHIRTRESGSVEHTLFSISKQMADGMQELAQKAGWNSSIRKVKPQRSVIIEEGVSRTISNEGGYSVCFKKRATRAELLRRNFKEIDYDGRIYCLNVPYHTLYVRRNGKPSWNGNTPACAIMQLTPQGQMRVLDEKYSEDMGIERFARDVVKPLLATEKYQGMAFQSVGDPAGKQRAQTNEVTCMQMLEMQGLKTEAAPTNSFIPRREAVAWFLTKMVDGQPGFLVSPNCDIIRKGFMGGYQYRRQKAPGGGDKFAESPDKNEFSHLQDAVQYGCSFIRSASRDVGAGGFHQAMGREYKPVKKKNFSAWS